MQHTEFAKDTFRRELPRAASLHLVPSDEEVTNMIVDVVIDRPVSRHPGAIAEVR
jgi:hypothetical protein